MPVPESPAAAERRTPLPQPTRPPLPPRYTTPRDSSEPTTPEAPSTISESVETPATPVDVPEEISRCSSPNSSESGPIQDYGSPEYWDERYESEAEPFDWLVTYDHLQSTDLLEKYLTRADEILVVGCGNATFSGDLYDAGYVHQTNIDLSSVAIEKMRARNARRTEMSFHVMDVRELQFAGESFDVTLDKSTLDCLFCCDESDEKISDMLRECHRVLRAGGLYFCVTLHNSCKVLEVLEEESLGWKWIITYPIPNPRYDGPESRRQRFHHVVIARK